MYYSQVNKALFAFFFFGAFSMTTHFVSVCFSFHLFPDMLCYDMNYEHVHGCMCMRVIYVNACLVLLSIVLTVIGENNFLKYQHGIIQAVVT